MGSEDVLSAGERLRRLEAVSDAALSRLDVSDLLDELLERVRDLLDADTATILLLDPHSQQLVATAAKGLEQEVRQGLRIPVGHGFAGGVAQQRRPVVLSEVTEDSVVSPSLLVKGVRSLLGVPILAAGEVVGVLHVGACTPRQFTRDDIRLLELAADRASVAGQIRSRKLDQAAALALQRSLLPPVLPQLPGLTFAARYVPGHDFGIGGDWYDIFTLPSGWVGMVIGDVSGHGLASAIVMGRVRSALRAYSLISDDPAEVLALLDRKVEHFEAGSLTTALYVMIAPDRTELRISSAGHLRPVLAVAGGPGELVEMPIDAPLGIGRPRARRDTVIGFPADGLLLSYTDGLVERRGEVIDVGLKRLTDTVVAGDPEVCAATVMATFGHEQKADDIAIVAVQRTGGCSA
ncbi:SpoIIE family protein phosphatase [Actinoplanes sp. Pm04-4]|uniref:SpoIIE family protein phosphatase n=1 Tax=Paractinoplanes pyxinae TaxID=2997416 RepID=A0ABT4BCH5_9ACTN|nr:GAF domain-containing SpoIIE family protein phosphatase [Actinoplanes pyxinae]MCY1144216.1 SpoIIE family protein phosphatase [Actinoplanes pyxinae]